MCIDSLRAGLGPNDKARPSMKFRSNLREITQIIGFYNTPWMTSIGLQTCLMAQKPGRILCLNSGCSKPVGLEPGAVLGCIKKAASPWICPMCDNAFTLKAGAPVEAQPSAAGTAVPAPAVDIAKLFAEIDKFTSHVLSMPSAANDPSIMQKVELATEWRAPRVVRSSDTAAF